MDTSAAQDISKRIRDVLATDDIGNTLVRSGISVVRMRVSPWVLLSVLTRTAEARKCRSCRANIIFGAFVVVSYSIFEVVRCNFVRQCGISNATLL